MPEQDLGRRKALFLAVPSLLVATAGVVLLPWLLNTLRMLQNDHWEGQVLFAITALLIALCSVPFVWLRIFRRVHRIAITGWIVTAAGYAGMTAYMVQSHVPVIPKLSFTLLGIVCLHWAIQGLRLDSAARLPSAQ